MSAPAIRIDGVARRFPGGVTALSDVSLTLAEGSFTALVGPSGCGKSTLLRLIGGLDDPSAGSITRASDRLSGPQGHATSCVFQDATLMPWASVADNVRLPLRLAGQSDASSAGAVGDALARVGLTGRERALPHELSGGMRMRVSIARALVTGARLLLLDEPFAALDEVVRFRLNDELLRLWAEAALTIVFVTHSVFEAVYLAQRIIVMGGGRIVDEVPVHLPHPRTASMRTTPAFGTIAAKVSQHLEGAAA